MSETQTVTATEFATSKDGTKIAFERAGRGPLLVLVDGALCSRAFGPSPELAGALKEDFTVVSYDRRGRGESGDTAPYAAEREFDDLAAVITAAGGDAFVMGQSSGAGIAYRAAAAGVPMRRLIGYEAPWVGLNKNKDGSPKDYLGTLEGYLAKGERGKAVGFFMVDMVGGPFFLPLMMRMMGKVWRQLQAVAHTLPYDTRVMGGDFEPPIDELKSIDIPTLVLVGGKAAKKMAAAQQKIAATIPNAEMGVLDGQTHQVAPAALKPEFIRFFTQESS
ncbi:MAG: alpha/beta fold hydrolase [Pseudolysinimonas sp.]|uniref:alpha/beta fold hydrolase n=1 Tax=Pseudolysinimonas sp. TaxID=2680009 RepID=UPI0032631649